MGRGKETERRGRMPGDGGKKSRNCFGFVNCRKIGRLFRFSLELGDILRMVVPPTISLFRPGSGALLRGCPDCFLFSLDF